MIFTYFSDYLSESISQCFGLKSKIKLIYFFPPTPSVTRGPILSIWDHGGLYRTPQTAVNTPKTTPSPQWLSLWVISKSLGKKSKIKPFFLPHTPSVTRGPISPNWGYRGPHWTPQTTIDTPKTIPYSIASSIVCNIRKLQPIIQYWTGFFPTLLICHKGSHIAHLGPMGALSGPPISRTCP